MRFLVAVAVLVTAAAGTLCAQRGAGHGGFSGHAAPAAHGGMRSFGPGRMAGPPRAPGGRMPVGHMPVGRMPAGRGPYTGIGVQHSGFGPQHAGLGPAQRVGERRTGFAGTRMPYRGTPNGSQPGWGGRDRGRGRDWDHDGDRDRGRHRNPYWPGVWNGLGYGISGWYLSPYVLGYPDTFGYDNSGQYADYGGNQVPYADNYGAPGSYGDYGQQGYGPDPGYQPGYDAPAWQAPNGPGPQQSRMSYVPLSPAIESAAVTPTAWVTLIFKDGRPPERIHNYLLTSTKLTIVDDPYREIPLDQINMGATEEANKAAGIVFRMPSGTR